MSASRISPLEGDRNNDGTHLNCHGIAILNSDSIMTNSIVVGSRALSDEFVGMDKVQF